MTEQARAQGTDAKSQGPSYVLTPGITDSDSNKSGTCNDEMFELPGRTASIKAFPEPTDLGQAIEDAFLDEMLVDEYFKFTQCQRKVLPFKCVAPGCGKEFYVPYRCDLRICPKCNARYGKKFMARYLGLFKQFMSKKSKDRLMLLTLTTKNTGNFPEPSEIKRHNKAVKKLVKTFYKGAVAVNELKGTFLHTHAVVYGPYVPKRQISKLWKELTGCEVLWISGIKGKAKDVALYVAKYIRKPYPYEQTREGYGKAAKFLVAFKGVRRVHSYGVFYGAGKGFEKQEFCCPWCGSKTLRNGGDLILDQAKYDLGWSVKECRIRGTPSYSDALRFCNQMGEA